MGLVGGLLSLPFSGPLWCFRLLAERLRDEAEAAMLDEERGFTDLLALSMRRSAGKISDAEYAEQEAAVLERLAAIREYKEELLQAELDAEWDAAAWEADQNELLEAEPSMDEVQC